jgi:S-disulfanyl-L-cysteine oxidoreductase SoxD
MRTDGRTLSLGLAGAVLCCLAVLGSSLARAQTARTAWDGVYTKAQAARGHEAYKLACGYCHKDDLSGGFMDDGVGRAAALAGPMAFGSSFAERWKDQSLGDMVFVIASTMPKESPTSLSLTTYVDIVAYVLERNGAPAGETELAVDVVALRAIEIAAK